jgi:hypothetical protein
MPTTSTRDLYAPYNDLSWSAQIDYRPLRMADIELPSTWIDTMARTDIWRQYRCPPWQQRRR